MATFQSLFIALTAFGALLAFFVAMYFLVGPDPELEERWALSVRATRTQGAGGSRGPSPLAAQLNTRIGRMGFAGRMQVDLARANLPMTVPEYVLVTAGVVVGGFIIGGIFTRQFVGALIIGALAYFLPGMYVKRRQAQRLKMFQAQLADVLSLLVSSLRAGYGLIHAMGLVVQEMPAPSSEEFGRVVREVGLGFSLKDALSHLVRRVDSDDLELMVTAINIQHEVGGNLAEILETISATIRERVRIKGEIAVMTSSQRLTSYLLVGLPLFIGVAIMFINPSYMMGMFQPGWPLLIPITAGVMMVFGFILTRKVIQFDY
ncbi:MAG: type II secretion system F family protein [Anaerolineae bacterium]|nr:type II secretion system F family protein [Anaerolineae bacterium]